MIRDDYPDRTVYQCVVSTDDALKGGQAYFALCQRWAIEEGFMDLTRYWNLEHFGSCRPLVAAAQTHFTLLAYSLLHLYKQDCDRQLRQCPPPILAQQKEITVYWGNHYAILLPSELLAIIFDHFEALVGQPRATPGGPTLRRGPLTTPPRSRLKPFAPPLRPMYTLSCIALSKPMLLGSGP